MRRVLVLGAGGMLGHKVCQAFSGHEVHAMIRTRPDPEGALARVLQGTKLIVGVDVLDHLQLETTLRESEPNVVINCVGLVSQHPNAGDAPEAIALNALLPHRLVALTARAGARLIHVSTDCVFKGDSGPYSEDSPRDADDLYGRSKALGETLDRDANALTIRTSFIGRELNGVRRGLLEWFLNQGATTVNGYHRVLYSGLTSLELAKLIRSIVDHHPSASGVAQVASEPIDKYSLLKLVAKIYRLPTRIKQSENPILDRRLLSGPFFRGMGYTAPSWRTMIEELHSDDTDYANTRSGD